MRNVAIIQARMGSSRLPGKILMQLNGASILETVVRRVRQASRIDSLIVATSTLERDDAVIRECERIHVDTYRGSETDLMERYLGAAEASGADVIVRITADCPLVDYRTIDEIIEVFHAHSYDYVLKDELPGGLTSEAFSIAALKRALQATNNYDHREHIVLAFTELQDDFHSYIFYPEPSLRRPDMKLSVDTAEEYELLRRIFAYFGPQIHQTSVKDIIEYVDKMK